MDSNPTVDTPEIFEVFNIKRKSNKPAITEDIVQLLRMDHFNPEEKKTPKKM